MPASIHPTFGHTWRPVIYWLAIAALSLLNGCGTTAQRGAMEQLLVSDAVDQAVSKIDFSPLTDQKVFIDINYIKTVKPIGFVNSEYVISTLRHRVVAAGCLLQEKIEDAEIILEPRVGSLGTDEYNITYGIPRSDTASSLASLAANSPVSLPAIPEIAISKSEYRQGFAKLSVFAYRKENQTAVWQSGVAKSTSTSRDTWVFGAGPIQRGTVYEGTRFAGSKLKSKLTGKPLDKSPAIDPSYRTAKLFDPILIEAEAVRLAQADQATLESEASSQAKPLQPVTPNSIVR